MPLTFLHPKFIDVKSNITIKSDLFKMLNILCSIYTQLCLFIFFFQDRRNTAIGYILKLYLQYRRLENAIIYSN